MVKWGHVTPDLFTGDGWFLRKLTFRKIIKIDNWPSVTLPIDLINCSTKMSNFSCCFLFRSGISGIGMIHSDKHWYHSHLNGILKWFKTNLGRRISLAPKFSNFSRQQIVCYIFNIRSPFVISSHDLGDIVMCLNFDVGDIFEVTANVKLEWTLVTKMAKSVTNIS